jgi:hypothetical protein
MALVSSRLPPTNNAAIALAFFHPPEGLGIVPDHLKSTDDPANISWSWPPCLISRTHVVPFVIAVPLHESEALKGNTPPSAGLSISHKGGGGGGGGGGGFPPGGPGGSSAMQAIVEWKNIARHPIAFTAVSKRGIV